MELYCSLILNAGIVCTGEVGALEPGPPGSVEASLGYHPDNAGLLTRIPHRDGGPCQAGSLTGAVAS